ncbi:Neil3 [Symbiodinium natans]|uniref:Neil3 protein n=1 Tax=Symbiodinium natans TaxID=878477 RepID=A0A812S910_9DINO|nr:Neil3 [Symbiodinium natans]
MPKFQLKLGDKWEDFVDREDEVLMKAFLSGKKFAEFHSRGQDYYVDFAKMLQRNKKTGKERPIKIIYDEEGKPKPAKMEYPKPTADQALHGMAGSRPPVVEGAVVGYTPGMSPAHAPALGLVVLLDVVCLLTLLVTQSSSVQT